MVVKPRIVNWSWMSTLICASRVDFYSLLRDSVRFFALSKPASLEEVADRLEQRAQSGMARVCSEHSRRARGHRVWNLHPYGGKRGDGPSPGIESSLAGCR
jgi:hypothetical protein